MEKINPWNDNIDLNNIFKFSSRKEVEIYGPLNIYKKREYIKFIFYKNINFINISSNENNFEIRVDINLEDESAKINQIETFKKNNKEFYSGTDIMKLLLKILKNINIKKVYLIDQSKKICKNRINQPKFLFSNTIPYSLITLLKNNKTLYMKFGFKPYLNGVNKSKNIIDNLNLLKTIRWKEIYEIINNGERTIQYIKEGNNVLNNIKNLDTWILYWKIIKKSFDYIYNKFSSKYIGPFDAYNEYDHTECQMFINWLELYSLSKYYEKTNYNFYLENGTTHTFIIPYKKEFLNLLNLLKKSDWIIENLQIDNGNININALNRLYKNNIKI